MSESAPPLPVAPYVVIGLVAAAEAAGAALDATAEVLTALGARPLAPDGRANTRAFATSATGVVLASSRVDDTDPRFVAIEIWVTGDLLGAPDWMPLSEEEETQSQRTQAFVARAFTAACERLDPLYAGLGVEWTPPLPSALRTAYLPCDLFRSARLDAADPRLAPDLVALFGAKGTAFARGTLIAAGGLLDADADAGSPGEPIAVGHAAAQRLARALDALYP